jgi:dihydroxy-acid dehydratase
MIELDVPNRRLHLDISEEELARRLAEWKPNHELPESGYAWLHQQHVQGADTGADLDFLKGCRGSAVGKDSH